MRSIIFRNLPGFLRYFRNILLFMDAPYVKFLYNLVCFWFRSEFHSIQRILIFCSSISISSFSCSFPTCCCAISFPCIIFLAVAQLQLRWTRSEFVLSTVIGVTSAKKSLSAFRMIRAHLPIRMACRKRIDPRCLKSSLLFGFSVSYWKKYDRWLNVVVLIIFCYNRDSLSLSRSKLNRRRMPFSNIFKTFGINSIFWQSSCSSLDSLSDLSTITIVSVRHGSFCRLIWLFGLSEHCIFSLPWNGSVQN